MSDTVIKVENLSKSYIIGHQRQESYTSLRDVMADSAKSLARRLSHPFTRHASRVTDSQEEFFALRDVSFEIKQGDRVGIIGRNGAGKSTLLKILSRITEPSSGRVTIKGRVASLLEVGTGFHPELTGRENIFLNGAILGMSRVEIKSKFDEIVAFAEVERFLDTPVKRYSSGMYVRLAFAVAAHLEPEILIVDEVLAVGDAQFQKKCLGRMAEVGREGRTVLFVSHNLTAIRTLCDRALLLQQGVLVTDASSEEVIAQYHGDLRSSTFERLWPDEKSAPQNSSTALLAARVYLEDENIPEEIFTDMTFDIDLTYRVKIDSAFVGLTMIVYDIENNIVFSTINNREPEWYGQPMPAGLYRSKCRIPGNLLNNGWYSFTLNIFGSNFSDLHTVSELIKINIQDTETLRGDYFGAWGGAVRPDIQWKTLQESEKS